MINADAHQKFVLLVQTAALVKDMRSNTNQAATVVAHVMDIDTRSFTDFEDDMVALANMAYEFVNWQYGAIPRPKWISFYNGTFA
jgi:hypothetical protein